MKSIPMALLIPIFMAGCGETDQRLGRVAKAQGVLEATRELPDQPADCRRIVRSGVRSGDRLDTALLKTDAALSRHHQITRFCADWYDALQDGFKNPQ